MAVSGHVRLGGKRVESASQMVRAGDVLTIALEDRVRVLEVTGFAPRRGNAAAAAVLYRDLSPPPPPRGD
jgi:ribosome-associated heat shock protein Hsp15